MPTCSATKKFSNADIAVKKEGVDRTATTAKAAATKMSLPASQLATHPANQLAIQKATTQAANETVAFECRHCSAEFSSNSQLHHYIRESHDKKTVLSTVHSAVKNSAPSSASRIIPPLSTPLAISATTSYT